MSTLFCPRHWVFRLTCCFMAVLMATTPSLVLHAQQPDAAKPSYVLPQTCVVILARPRQLFTSPALAMMPIEVLQAASIKETGLDPLEAEELIISVEPPVMGPPSYAVLARFTKPAKMRTGVKATEHTVASELDGRPYLKSQNPLLPSFYYPDEKTVLATPELTLQNFVAGRLNATDGLLHSKLKQAAGDDLYVAVDLAPLRPLIQMGLAEARKKMPPEVEPFLEAPNLIRTIELRLNLSGQGPTELVVEANHAADAERLVQLVEQAKEMWSKQFAAEFEKFKHSDDPVEQAMGRYQERMSATWSEQLRPQREGNRLVIFRCEAGAEDNVLMTVAISGVLAGLLLPAVQAAREAARRNASMNNMKNIMLALHNYADRHKGTFLAHAIYDDNGKPLLSWRVSILRELENEELYNQFHLDEPWDSEHNKTLIAKMPEVFNDPSSGLAASDGKSHYVAPVGARFVFDGTPKGKGFASIRDGSSNTIMLLQVDDKHAPVWTKPDDWQYNAKQPKAGLGRLHPGIFLAGFADAHVKSISNEIDVDVFKAMLTCAGGEFFDQSDW